MRLRIGQVAQATGLSVETIRYYERLGLVAAATRTPSGYRQFEADVVERLRFVQRAQALGFSLEDVRELLELRLIPGSPAADVRRRAEAKLADIRSKARDLERMGEALERLVLACCGDGASDDCPILKALGGDARD